jgi:hypothetical protein
MDSFQEFISTHPLTEEEVETMFTFLDHALQIELVSRMGDRYLTIGDILDILVMYYE